VYLDKNKIAGVMPFIIIFQQIVPGVFITKEWRRDKKPDF
jgi:hypothetical protein